MAATAIYEYAGDDASSYPGIGNIAIQTTTGQNRLIAISVIDADGDQRNLSVIVPGDSLTITNEITPPVTSFARYLITGPATDWGSYVEFPAKRTDTAGTTTPPAIGTRLAVTPTLAAHDHDLDYDPIGTLDDEAEIEAIKARLDALEPQSPSYGSSEGGDYLWQATGGTQDPGWGHAGWNPGVKVAIHKVDADKIAHDSLDNLVAGDQVTIVSLDDLNPGSWVLTLSAPADDRGAHVSLTGTITGSGGTLPPSDSEGPIRIDWTVTYSGRYCSIDDLKPFIGGSIDDARANVAIESASRWIDTALGLTAPFADVPARINLAAINVSVRFYRSPEAPFGVIGAGEAAMYVGRYAPDVEALLRGYYQSFGMA